jgi:hypothetical protein
VKWDTGVFGGLGINMKVSLEDQGSSSFRAKVWESGDPSPPRTPREARGCTNSGGVGPPPENQAKIKTQCIRDRSHNSLPRQGLGIR